MKRCRLFDFRIQASLKLEKTFVTGMGKNSDIADRGGHVNRAQRSKLVFVNVKR